MSGEQPRLSSSKDRSLHKQHSLKRRRTQDTKLSEYAERKFPLPNGSEAAEFNRRVLKKLQSAFNRNPEIDLLSQFPSDYLDRLRLKSDDLVDGGDLPSALVEPEEQGQSEADIRSMIDPACAAEIIYPLSPSIYRLLVGPEQTFDEIDISRHVLNLLSKSEAIRKGPIPTTRAVFRCGLGAVVKVVWNIDDYTEYTMLQFLDKQLPKFPAPKPLGVLRIGQLSFIFASYIPGQTLQEAWPELSRDQKLSIMDQLETTLSDLRSINRPPDLPLGGVQGEGCKDFRRNVRRAKDPIYTVEQYDNFLFSNARFGSKMYLEFLRKFTAETTSQICLSHGDIRPDNIIVQRDQNGMYSISGFVDWEFSGFYPCHYESTKTTNCLSTDETGDWYGYLPACLSPHMRPQRWLLDYVLGRLLE